MASSGAGGVPGAQRAAWVGDYCPTPEKVKVAASTVLDVAGFCLRYGASAPLKYGWGAGGVAGGTGNDASCGAAGKGKGRIAPALGVAVSFR